MKSFTIAAFAGAASAAWAPPAYGGSSESAVSSSTPAEEYTQPAGYASSSTVAASTSSPSAPAYGGWGSSSSSVVVSTSSSPSAPAYGGLGSSSSMKTYASASSSSSAAASSPVPTGGYGGSWGSGNGTWGRNGGDSYVTQVVTSFETYCPYATTMTYGSKTYTVSSATTLTVTDCPGGCAISTPWASYKPSMTTEVVTSYVTTCPVAGEYTFGTSTFTATESTVVTACAGGCTVTNEVPATWVVPTYTTYCPSPSAPATVTIGTETYPYTEATTIVVTAPTSYATYTSVMSAPASPTSVVIASTTYPVSEATTITYSQATQQGYTVTAPYSSIWSAPPAAYSTPAGPVGTASSGWAPAGNATSAGPYVPEQTGNGAEKIMAGGAAFAALVGALFL